MVPPIGHAVLERVSGHTRAMWTLSHEEWIAFANEGTRTGKLATTRADGRPHVTPIWFLVDEAGEHVYFNTGTNSLKGKALRRDPRFAVCVDLPEPPYSFVLLECEATLSEDVAAMLPWSIRLGARYMGAERGEEFGRRNATAGEYLVRGRIVKVTALGGIAD
jgi:PPOX class probable F420-dependent enzyme